MINKLICITCPMGCHLQIESDERHEVIAVTGNRCPRGAAYAKKELTAPERMITSTVRIEGAIHPLLPVMSEKEIPKAKIFDVMDEIRKVKVQAPVTARSVIIANVCHTGVDIIASRSMKAINNRKEEQR